MDLQLILNTYATDIFRKQADYDYISARSNYRLKLRQQFLWSAQQAVEKYLKAILLFNGKSIKRFSHDLDTLVDEVEKIKLLNFALDSIDEKFLAYLSKQGCNRYLSTSAYNMADAIQSLDKLVWNIRRYCQFIPDRGIGGKLPVDGLQEAIVSKINNPNNMKRPHKFKLFRGELENIINKDPKDPARKALIWANLWYGKKKRVRVLYNSFSSSEIPPNERGWNGVNWDEISRYIKIDEKFIPI